MDFIDLTQESDCETIMHESDCETDVETIDLTQDSEDQSQNYTGFTSNFEIYHEYFILESMVFRFGKFHGSSVSQLMNQKQYRYLQWVASQDSFRQQMIVYHIRTHILRHTKLDFGKYKHKTLHEIKTQHARYWWWLKRWRKSLVFLQHV